MISPSLETFSFCCNLFPASQSVMGATNADLPQLLRVSAHNSARHTLILFITSLNDDPTA